MFPFFVSFLELAIADDVQHLEGRGGGGGAGGESGGGSGERRESITTSSGYLSDEEGNNCNAGGNVGTLGRWEIIKIIYPIMP